MLNRRTTWPMPFVGTFRTWAAKLRVSVPEGKADLPGARPDF